MNEVTDLERFVALYKSFGIDVIVNSRPDGSKTIYMCRSNIVPGKTTVSDKFGGETHTSTQLNFNESGNFMGQYFFS